MILIIFLKYQLDIREEQMIKYKLRHYGGCSQVVKAVGCDSTIRRFKSGHSPLLKLFILRIFKNLITN